MRLARSAAQALHVPRQLATGTRLTAISKFQKPAWCFMRFLGAACTWLATVVGAGSLLEGSLQEIPEGSEIGMASLRCPYWGPVLLKPITKS